MWTATPAPTKALERPRVATPVPEMTPEDSTRLISLTKVFELYWAWLMTRLTAKRVPPAVREFDPAQMAVLVGPRPTVQWAALRTHLLEMRPPPQKWPRDAAAVSET